MAGYIASQTYRLKSGIAGAERSEFRFRNAIFAPKTQPWKSRQTGRVYADLLTC